MCIPTSAAGNVALCLIPMFTSLLIIILNNNIIIVYVEIIHMDAINPYLVQCAVHGRTGDCFWDAGSAVWIWTDQ